jgi:transcriptional regulator GlxA family with amidase domain
MHALHAIGRLGRATLKPLSYLVAIALPSTLAIVFLAASVISQGPLAPPPAFSQPLPDRPVHDPSKPTAVVLADNLLTEVSDLLAPYEVLAASGQYNVYVVAPERRLSPLGPVPVQQCCAFTDLVPHYSFAEYDQLVGVSPALIVVPYIPGTDGPDAAVLSWLRERPGDQTIVLSICGGAQMVADSGILAGHTATSHHTTLQQVVKSHPEVNWVQGVRYVDDGRFISSAGVTSGVDATLHTLDRFFGREVALETARRVGYPHTRFLDDRAWTLPSDNDTAALPNLFRFSRAKLGLFLYDGVDEIALSSVTDTYPRALNTDVLTIGAERQIVRTKHGLDLVPRYGLASTPTVERLLIPGQPEATVAAPAERWAEARLGRAAERIHAGGAYAYDLTIADMAQRDTRLVARNAARWIEYPTAHLQLGDRDWQLGLILRAVALTVLSPLLLLAVRRLRSRRRAAAAREISRSHVVDREQMGPVG